MSWTPPRNLVIPWMKALSEQLSGLTMPLLRGPRLWVLSDYSFGNPASDFDVVGILVADPQALGHWNCWRSEVRERLLPDRRTMSWKKLNSDWRRESAFFPFLVAANQIHGLAVAIAFHRNTEFDLPTHGLSRFKDSLNLSAEWKPRQFEQMFRIAYCAATFIAGLSSPGQHFHWISDQDHVFANETIEKDTVSVVVQLLNMFSPHKLGELRYGTTGITKEDLVEEDLAAIPDLMCGATCEIATAIKRKYTDFPQIYTELPKLTRRPQEFLKWYSSDHWPLKRYICTFEARNGKEPSLGIMHPSLMGRGPILIASENRVPRGWPL